MAVSSRIDLIVSLANQHVSENDAIAMFESGANSDHPDHWDFEQLRTFLVDLCIAFNRAPVVSDDAVEAALREIQLDVNDQGRISKMEWKSFFLYLLDAPLKRLESIVFDEKLSSQPACNPIQTVVITMSGPNVKSLNKITTQSAIRKAVGPMTGFAFAKQESQASVLASFETPILVENALSLRELSSLDISELTVLQYTEGTVFPSWAQASCVTPSNKSPGLVAKALASTVLFGAMVGSQAKAIDERIGFSSTAKTALVTTKQTVADIDEKSGISKAVKDVAGKVDEKLHIKESAEIASKKTSDAVDQVKKTQPAQSTMAFVGGLFGKVKSVADNLKSETELALEQKRSQK